METIWGTLLAWIGNIQYNLPMLMERGLYILLALLLLDVLVIMHELGHFLSARALKIPVLEFAVGMGPKIIRMKRKGTYYSLRLFPVGGYCKFMGEDDGGFEEPGALNNQAPWKRFVMVLSGPAMNFALAYAAMLIYLITLGSYISVPMLYGVEADAPAGRAGLAPGDVITAVNGVPIPFDESGAALMRQMILTAEEQEAILFTVDRKGQEETISLIPERTAEGSLMIGIVMDTMRARTAFPAALRDAGILLRQNAGVMLEGLRNLIFRGEGAGEVIGAVGIVDMMSREIRNGADQIIALVVLLSLNFGILNLLPIPALDGSRLVFIALEGIFRRPIKPEIEGWIHAGGLALILGLAVLLVYKDVARLIGG